MFAPFKYAFPTIISQNSKLQIQKIIPSQSLSFFQNQTTKYQPEVQPIIQNQNTFSEINLVIDNKEIGKIIGKSGNIIEKIRKISKAKIKIYDNKIGSKRKVKITGNTNNVQIANKMIIQYLL
jgi:predicted RNA-binding protein YlqC (UPF0109 family)